MRDLGPPVWEIIAVSDGLLHPVWTEPNMKISPWNPK